MWIKKFLALFFIVALSISAREVTAASLRNDILRPLKFEILNGTQVFMELRQALEGQIDAFASSLSAISGSLPRISVTVTSAASLIDGLSEFIQATENGTIMFSSPNVTNSILENLNTARTRVQGIVTNFSQFIGMSVNGTSTEAILANLEADIRKFATDLQNLSIFGQMQMPMPIANAVTTLENFSADTLNGLNIDFIPASNVTTTAANLLCSAINRLPAGAINIPYPSLLNKLVPAFANVAEPFVSTQNIFQNTNTAKSLMIARQQTASIINELQALALSSSGSLQSRLDAVVDLTKGVEENLRQISLVSSLVKDINSGLAYSPDSVTGQLQNIANNAVSGEAVQMLFPSLDGLWNSSTFLINPSILPSNVISSFGTPNILNVPFFDVNGTDGQNIVNSVTSQLGNLAVNAESSGIKAIGAIAGEAASISNQVGLTGGGENGSTILTFLTPLTGNELAENLRGRGRFSLSNLFKN